MKVRDGCAEAFERTWRDAAAMTSDYPGALAQTMLRSPDDPLRYTITADWDSRENLAKYQLSEDRKALSATLDQLRESATKSLLDVVAHIGSSTASTTKGTVGT
ncbi:MULTISPECIES: antibiotic biosynthesis monooxygenase family protein [unclassified Streptomyces]|uniref:antibiotic biosynthesis monooxygenase family protein n=1 Tax=unclassified Streptomyces TaxID=2593676 RepID=UPI002E16C722|nr:MULTISPECIES: antibiotic biosynthesis monooxygenase family protein [unclassified Streptomyces]